MRSVFFLLLLTIFAGNAALAGEVTYSQIEATKGNFKSFRDAWDKTGQFCFKAETVAESCFNIDKMGEVKVRAQGKWSTDPKDLLYIEALSEDARRAAEEYETFYVRYLAIDSAQKFVVHAFYSGFIGTQTMFLMGRIDRGQADVSSISFSSRSEYDGAIALSFLALAAADKSVADDFSKIKSEDEQRAYMHKMIEPQLPKLNAGLINISAEVVNQFLLGQ